LPFVPVTPTTFIFAERLVVKIMSDNAGRCGRNFQPGQVLLPLFFPRCLLVKQWHPHPALLLCNKLVTVYGRSSYRYKQRTLCNFPRINLHSFMSNSVPPITDLIFTLYNMSLNCITND
jgi:hypothetical protein